MGSTLDDSLVVIRLRLLGEKFTSHALFGAGYSDVLGSGG